MVLDLLVFLTFVQVLPIQSLLKVKKYIPTKKKQDSFNILLLSILVRLFDTALNTAWKSLLDATKIRNKKSGKGFLTAFLLFNSHVLFQQWI